MRKDSHYRHKYHHQQQLMARKQSTVIDFSDTNCLIDNMVTMINPTEQLTEHTMVEKTVFNDCEIDDIINSKKSSTAIKILATGYNKQENQPSINLRKKKKLDNFELRKDIVHNEKNLTLEYNIYLRDIKIGVIKPYFISDKEHVYTSDVRVFFISKFPSVITNISDSNIDMLLKRLKTNIEMIRDFIRLFESD